MEETPEKLIVQMFKTIDDIGREAIDSISNDGFFTYEWFKTLEKQSDFPIQPYYLTVYNNSELVAFTPCFLDKLDQYFVYGLQYLPFMKELLQLGNKLGLWQKHVLLCHSPFCYRSKVLTRHNNPPKEIFNLLNERINKICKNERILFSSFPFVSERDTNLLKSLASSGYSKLHWKNTLYIDIPWSSFEEYLQSLDYKTRKNVVREIKKFSENRITIEEISKFGELDAKLADLFSNLFKKYNPWDRPPVRASLIRSLSENAHNVAKIFIAKKDGEIVGFLLLMKHKENLDCVACGFHYDLLSKTDFTYFNLVYYYPIKWAIQKNIKKIYYRYGAEKVKLRRGCKQEQIFSNLKSHNKLLYLFFNLYINLKYSKIGSWLLPK